ncbi:MAG: efflux RND transporter periplasmic adaptor subunit [Vicinamibacterales bacterium]
MRAWKLVITVIALGGLGSGGYAYYKQRQTPPEPTINTAQVVRGDIADTVGATGTLQAVTTVQVGTQVSGTIQELHADFNTLVRRGQVLARLDPSLFNTQIEQARANLIRANADVERLRVALDDAQTKLKRSRELADRKLIAIIDLEAAEVAVRSAEAQLRSAQAQVTQAQASLSQNEVNLEHTVITAPIDGLVISRNVDVGQTVAASMQAPTLFVLAADLTKMQVVANLDESDIGRIRPRQAVSFRVDAYPAQEFAGTVSQVRLQPQVVQNVVTYSTVIDVPNPQLLLKPGMTANVTIEIAHRSGILRVPNAALRFRPTNEIFAALGQEPPSQGLNGGGRRPEGSDVAAASSAPGSALPSGVVRGDRTAASGTVARTESDRPTDPPAAGAVRASQSAGGSRDASGESAVAAQGRGRGAGDGTGGGRGRMLERLNALPPEERAEAMDRLRARGVTLDAQSDASSAAAASRREPAPRSTAAEPATIDALFGPLPAVESVGRVWIRENGQLRPLRVRLGITDGQATELLDGELQEGMELVTNVTTGTETVRTTPTGVGFPMMGQPRMGGGGGAGRQGRGGGG